VVGLTQDHGGVDTVLRDGDRSEHVRVDWVIAADGAHSSVRHRLGLRFEGGAFREEFATADVRVDWPLPADELFAFLNRGNFKVQSAIDACGPAGARAVEIGDRSRFVIHQRTVERQSVGRVFLAGDAAHVHSVVGAQGLNIGVQDAFNLAWKLAAVISGTSAPNLLETYADERHPAARRIVNGTRRATRMTLLRRRPAVFARRHVAPLVLRRRRVRSTIEHALSQLDISYRSPGAVADTALVTGDRAPDVPLRHFGVAQLRGAPVTRLFEVIGRDEFSLLMVGGQDDLATRYRPIHQVASAFPVVHEYVVLPDSRYHADADIAATILVDVGNTLRRKYGIDQRAMLPIRPDGYLALRHDEWAPETLRNQLRRLLIPAQSTQPEEV